MRPRIAPQIRSCARPCFPPPTMLLSGLPVGVVKYYLGYLRLNTGSNLGSSRQKRRTSRSGSTVSALRETATSFTRRGWPAGAAWSPPASIRLFAGIAVEGLSEEDEEGAPAAAVEIADATFYYGNWHILSNPAHALEIAQFKYSISQAGTPTANC